MIFCWTICNSNTTQETTMQQEMSYLEIGQQFPSLLFLQYFHTKFLHIFSLFLQSTTKHRPSIQFKGSKGVSINTLISPYHSTMVGYKLIVILPSGYCSSVRSIRRCTVLHGGHWPMLSDYCVISTHLSWYLNLALWKYLLPWGC